MTRPPKHRGFTVVEALVSLTLLVATVSLVATFAVRNLRVMADSRAHRLAVDELSNRLARLTSAPSERAQEVHAELDREPLVGLLAGAEVDAAFAADGSARRITLTLRWPEAVARPPVTLAGWSFAEGSLIDGGGSL